MRRDLDLIPVVQVNGPIAELLVDGKSYPLTQSRLRKLIEDLSNAHNKLGGSNSETINLSDFSFNGSNGKG